MWLVRLPDLSLEGQRGGLGCPEEVRHFCCGHFHPSGLGWMDWGLENVHTSHILFSLFQLCVLDYPVYQ